MAKITKGKIRIGGDIAKRKRKVPQVLRQEFDSLVGRSGSIGESSLGEDPATGGLVFGAKLGANLGLAMLSRGQNGVEVLGESGDYGDMALPEIDKSQISREVDILPDSKSRDSNLMT